MKYTDTVYLIAPPSGEKRKVHNYSLLYLKHYLKAEGHGCEVMDSSVEDRNLPQLVAYLKEKKAKYIGIAGYTKYRFAAYETIRAVKKQLPDAVIILGGNHFSPLREETLKAVPEADFVIEGEGEVTLAQLIKTLKSGVEPYGVQGISYRRDARVFNNPSREVEQDIEKFQYTEEDLPAGGYTLLSRLRHFPLKTGFMVLTGRGCPGACVFCTLNVKRVRLRPMEAIFREIEWKIKNTGCRNVIIMDSTFTLNRRRVEEFCEEVLRKDLRIKWHCYSRADVAPDIFRIMKKAGCVSLDLGLESASPAVQKAIRKNIDPGDVMKVVEECGKRGISVLVFAMLSLPGETRKEALTTLAFLEKIADKVLTITYGVTVIYPDAMLYPMAVQKKLLPEGFSWFSPYRNDLALRIGFKGEKELPYYLEGLSEPDIEELRGKFIRIYRSKVVNIYHFWTALRTSWRPFFSDFKKQSFNQKIHKLVNAFFYLKTIIKKIVKNERVL
ncbi:MAG TPA: radical SAM protein [bacterium]|nr:radical SAM protein [bacterium]